MNSLSELKNKKVAIVSHVYAPSTAHELEEYLREKAAKIIFIGHPFTFVCKDSRSWFRLTNAQGYLYKEHKGYEIKKPNFLVYMKDVFYTLIWILKTGKYDLYVGVNNLNAFTGLILKKLGRVKKVVFYTIDYIPQRTKNKLLNNLYHGLDSFCVTHCDKTWNLSPVMVTEREKKGIHIRFRNRQITVPIGTNSNTKIHPIKDIDRYSIAFVSHLKPGTGIELLFDALNQIIKTIQEVKLVIIGRGPLKTDLEKQAIKLKLDRYIEFTGFIPENSVLEERLAKCAVGVAPYFPSPDCLTQYTDPGKPKTYLSAGLPVIITRVSQIANELEKERAGLVIKYDKNELAQAIISLFTDDRLFLEYRQNAIRFASKYSWDNVFHKALEKTI